MNHGLLMNDLFSRELKQFDGPYVRDSFLLSFFF